MKNNERPQFLIGIETEGLKLTWSQFLRGSGEKTRYFSAVLFCFVLFYGLGVWDNEYWHTFSQAAQSLD